MTDISSRDRARLAGLADLSGAVLDGRLASLHRAGRIADALAGQIAALHRGLAAPDPDPAGPVPFRTVIHHRAWQLRELARLQAQARQAEADRRVARQAAITALGRRAALDTLAGTARPFR